MQRLAEAAFLRTDANLGAFQNNAPMLAVTTVTTSLTA
jgi:hypothetical protein